VLVGFCGGGGTPLFSATERTVDIEWLSPQSEYRPTEYLQHWVRFWFVDSFRLASAKAIQVARLERVLAHWCNARILKESGYSVDAVALKELMRISIEHIEIAADTTALLAEEARLTKQLYKFASRATSYGEFTRAKRGDSSDTANGFLDHGNYLAYGLGATATWVLGLSHGLAVLHGKTRRGGLVFDAADLIKDAVILPQAFISAVRGDTEQEFRQACIDTFARTEALDFMIDTLKAVAIRFGQAVQLEDKA
jgi:CRISPR-associated protein Cas1